VRLKASQSAKDFLIELPERDTRSMLRMPTLKEMDRLLPASFLAVAFFSSLLGARETP
jgi:hypothetical protein